jgi:hypothetical protein
MRWIANNILEIIIRNPKEINYFGELGLIEREILKYLLEKEDANE